MDKYCDINLEEISKDQGRFCTLTPTLFITPLPEDEQKFKHGGCGVSVYYVARSTKEQAKRKKIEKNIKKGREREREKRCMPKEGMPHVYTCRIKK